MTEQKDNTQRRKRNEKVVLCALTATAMAVAVAIVVLWPYRWAALRTLCSWIPASQIVDYEWPHKDALQGVPYSSRFDGIDISRHQGRIRWEQLFENAQLKFVFVKATEGKTLTDPFYSRNVAALRKSRLKVGAYHFLNGKSDGATQFRHFAAVVDRHDLSILPLVDVENSGMKNRSSKQIKQTLQEFSDECLRTWGVRPIVYTNEKFYEEHLHPTFKNHKLFIANYNRRPSLPANTPYLLWQRSERGHVKGVWTHVDLDCLSSPAALKSILW